MPDSNSITPRPGNDPNESTTPEDVATLYSWANLHGAKYRDFSASRAQAREEARLRVEAVQAEERRRQQEEAERAAQEEAQLAARLAAEAAEAARQAEAERLAEIARQAEAERQAVLAAQEAQRQAALQRSWQPSPPEAAQADLIAEFNDSFSKQSLGQAPISQGPAAIREPWEQQTDANDNTSPDFEREAVLRETVTRETPGALDSGRPDQSQPQSSYTSSVPLVQRSANPFAAASTTQPYPPQHYQLQESASPAPAYSGFAAPAFQTPAFRDPAQIQSPFATPSELSERYRSSQQEAFNPSPWHPLETQEFRESRDFVSRPAWLAPEIPQAANVPAPPVVGPVQTPIFQPQTLPQAPDRFETPRPVPAQQSMYSQPAAQALNAFPTSQGAKPQFSAGNSFSGQPNLRSIPDSSGASDPRSSPDLKRAPETASSNPLDDTLHGSRDRIAGRWFALKSVFDPQAPQVEQLPAQAPAHVPALAVFSLAGGVGKTSLVASLGRALSSRGERVVLVDTAVYGLLPFFFGARDQRPGMLRTFNPPGVSADAPIQLVTIDPDGQFSDRTGKEPSQNPNQAGQSESLAEEVNRYTRSANRVLIDLPTASGATARRILRLSPIVLVPVLADMSSVVSVGAIESFFRNSVSARDSNGKPILPYYVLNQFDYSLPLHLDVREILREQIGDRLLPFALRRSSAVSEALAEGMTVMDYAPTAVVAEDYANLAAWVRSVSAPASQNAHKFGRVRWSEQ